MEKPPLLDQLLSVADAYCAAVGCRRSTLSGHLFNDGKRLDSVARLGRDLNTRSFERAMRWFSDNWPATVAWPAGIDRPEPSVSTSSRIDEPAERAAS